MGMPARGAACFDLRFGPFARPDEIDAVIPEVLADPLSFVDIFVLLDFRKYARTGFELCDEGRLRLIR